MAHRGLLETSRESVDDDVEAKRELGAVLALGEQGSKSGHIGNSSADAASPSATLAPS